MTVEYCFKFSFNPTLKPLPLYNLQVVGRGGAQM